MSFFSATLERVKPSPTVAVTGLAQALKAEGHDIIALGAGEPDFDTPQAIKDAALRAIAEGRTKYTAVDGIAELKAAICRKFERDNGLRYRPEQISVSSGGKQVLFNALLATLNPGDEVIIPAPYWVSYPDMVRMGGATPVIVPCPMEAGFKLTPAALEAAITPRSKWLILNSPSNPTGAALERDELRALADVLLRHPDLWIMADDIYEKITYDGFRFATLAEVEPRLQNRILTINGVSKAHAMTGWRIGYGAGPEPLIAAMRKVQSQTTSNPCTISQWASIEALDGDQSYIAQNNASFLRRRDLVVAALNQIPEIDCPVPRGAFYVFPSIAGAIGRVSSEGTHIATDEDFATALLRESGVAVVFGAAFGLSPHIRISTAASDEALQEACSRITEFCKRLR